LYIVSLSKYSSTARPPRFVCPAVIGWRSAVL